MTDPLTDLLAELAPTVDILAARDAFAARRARRRRRRRITGTLAALVLVVGGIGIAVLLRDDGAGTVVMSNQASTSVEVVRSTTVTEATDPSTSTMPPTTVAAALLAVDGCPTISASDLRTNEPVNPFSRETPDGLSIQAVATSAGVEGPYAAVLRYRSATRNPTFGDRVDVNGHEARLFIGGAGQGQISWILEDGSEAYLRSRHLDADQLLAIANALIPRPTDAAVVGFDLADAAPAGFSLVAETTAPLTTSGASTSCHTANGADLRVAVLDAPLAAQYAIGVDWLPLPALQRRGALLVMAVSHDPATAAAALGLQPPSPPPTDGATTTSFSPMPTVTFTIDRAAVGQPGCTSSACRFVDVTVAGFWPGMTVTITCQGDTSSAFSSTDATIGADGSATHEACYFGRPGERFWVSANGITSPTITWPAE
jgi:hypothetical protein